MYTFTLHFEYHSSANKDVLPEQTKAIEAIDERHATAMAHLEIQTMVPLSKIVDSQIVVYRPRLVKLALPSDYPPVVAALSKEIELDPVVEELKKQARQIYLEKHGFLPGEKRAPANPTPPNSEFTPRHRHTGILSFGYLKVERFSMEYVQQVIGRFEIETKYTMPLYLRQKNDLLLQKIASSLKMSNHELFEEIMNLCDANGLEEAADVFSKECSFLDFLSNIPVTDASHETIQDFLEEVTGYGFEMEPFRFFLHDLESEEIELPQQQAN